MISHSRNLLKALLKVVRLVPSLYIGSELDVILLNLDKLSIQWVGGSISPWL